jgi:hypothetical protein
MSDPSHDNPDLNRSYRNGSNTGLWAGILLAAFVIVIGLIFLLPKGDTVATSPGTSTTGSASQGASPSNPARSGNTPGTSGSGTTPSR